MVRRLVVDVPRNWYAVMADAQWITIRNPLRLQSAVERDFGPFGYQMKSW
jgi:hypothetical protein